MRLINESVLVVTGQPGSVEVVEGMIDWLANQGHQRKVDEFRIQLGSIDVPYMSNTMQREPATLTPQTLLGFLEENIIDYMNKVAGVSDGVALYFGRKPGTNEYGFWPICSIE